MNDMVVAYARGAEAWADGPTRIYGRLAQVLVAFSPVSLNGRAVLDLGSGTGAGSRAARRAGARVVATDLVPEMLQVGRSTRPPGTAGNAIALPFRDDAFDVVLAPFSLNHLSDPAVGVREAGRVATTLLASTYAADDDHPVKGAVEAALAEQGWQRPEWYTDTKAAMAAWGTVADARDAVARGGLRPLMVEHRTIRFGDLKPADMVAWRTGLAASASFVAALPLADQARLERRAIDLLGSNPPPVERRVILIAAAR